jgi:uncharacterized membrane protein YcaP (DUF421 family)
MRRRIVRPARPLAVLLGLVALPAVILWGSRHEAARQSVLQVSLSFAVLMLIFRVIGKRELSRLSPFELVTLMLVPEVLSNSVQGQDSLLQGLAGVCTLFALVLTVSLLAQRFPSIQRAVESPPIVLVSDGRMAEQAMNSERIAPEELFSEMRREGITELEEIQLAVLESGGRITFLRKARARENEE